MRYARQTVLPQIGEQGQARLAAAHVLVVGAGALGIPVLQYLTGAGVGAVALHGARDVLRPALHRAGGVLRAVLGRGAGVVGAAHDPVLDVAEPALGRADPTVHDAGGVHLLVEGVDVVAQLALGLLDLPADGVGVVARGHVTYSDV